jgi:hypothetical protein
MASGSPDPIQLERGVAIARYALLNDEYRKLPNLRSANEWQMEGDWSVASDHSYPQGFRRMGVHVGLRSRRHGRRVAEGNGKTSRGRYLEL